MKTVIEMAREAGLQEIVEQTATHTIVKNMDEAALERFAALVRENEREACAKTCEKLTSTDADGVCPVAAAIRARGEK